MNHNHLLTILQINDTHAYLEPHPELFWGPDGAEYRLAGGYARLAALANQARQENPDGVLLLDNGDTLHGTYPAVETQGKALVPVLNCLRPAAMTAHWEFAYGPQVLAQRASELDFPILGLNVTRQDTGELFFPAYQVEETAGLRVGITGIASNIVDKTMPPSFSEGLRFTLGRDELPQVIETLRTQENVDLVVLLSHLGFPQDMQLAAEVPGIDVLLSGHTHNRLYQPARQGETLIIQSGSHGSLLGRLDLEVESGRVAGVRHRLIEVGGWIEPDPQMADLVEQAVAPYRDLLSQVVGETAAALNRGYNLETTMDNFLLQAIREYTGAELAFSNGWRYGAPVLPGPVTLNDLYNIIPVNPPVSTVVLTGAELLEMLEENLEHTYARRPFEQMGGYVKRALGLKVYFRVENPAGQRIQALFAGEEEVRPERSYTAAFVTEQGVPREYGSRRQALDEHAVPVLRQYLADHSPLRVERQGTFTLV